MHLASKYDPLYDEVAPSKQINDPLYHDKRDALYPKLRSSRTKLTKLFLWIRLDGSSSYSELSPIFGDDFAIELGGGQEEVGGVGEGINVVVEEVISSNAHGKEGFWHKLVGGFLASQYLP